MEDSFVALMNDSFVASQAGGGAESPAADTTGKLRKPREEANKHVFFYMITVV